MLPRKDDQREAGFSSNAKPNLFGSEEEDDEDYNEAGNRGRRLSQSNNLGRASSTRRKPQSGRKNSDEIERNGANEGSEDELSP